MSNVAQHLADALVAAYDSDAETLALSFVRDSSCGGGNSTIGITGVISGHATVHTNGVFMRHELRQIATHMLAAAAALDTIYEREQAALRKQMEEAR